MHSMSAAEGALSGKRTDLILANLPDSKNDKTALQDTLESQGHILLLSPKLHPEVAVEQIVFSRDMSKVESDQRRRTKFLRVGSRT